MARRPQRRAHRLGVAHAPSPRYRACATSAIALVPTMGALHAGHLALVRRRAGGPTGSWSRSSSIRRSSRRTRICAPIRAPSTADLAALAALRRRRSSGRPPVETMYPDGFATRIVPDGPAKAGLEDKFRPHFFAGVATVVGQAPDPVPARLRGVRREGLPAAQGRHAAGAGPRPAGARSSACRRCARRTASRCPRATPTCRPSERAAAPTLHRDAARTAPAGSRAGEPIARVLDEGGAAIERAGFALDYLEARHAETLAPVDARRRTGRSGCWWRRGSARRG